MTEKEMLGLILKKIESLEAGQNDLVSGQKKLEENQQKLAENQQKTNDRLDRLEENQQKTNDRLDQLELNVSEIRRDVKKIGWQVDTLYQWVDDVDIRSKTNREIIDHLKQKEA